MKKYIYVLLMCLFTSSLFAQTYYQRMQNAIDLGTYSDFFNLSVTKNTGDYADSYTHLYYNYSSDTYTPYNTPARDIFYKLNVTSKSMDVDIRSYGNFETGTIVYILDATGKELSYYMFYKSDNQSVYTHSFQPGTYYIVTEAIVYEGQWNDIGSITISLGSKARRTGEDFFYPFIVGTYNSSFSTSSTLAYPNLNYLCDFKNGYAIDEDSYRRDIVHQFTITKSMDINIDNIGSYYQTKDALYMKLLTESMDTISSESTYELTPGTYSIYSKFCIAPYSSSKYILNITGKEILSGSSFLNPISTGDKATSFTYTHTQNTSLFSKSKIYTKPGNEAFYKLTLTAPMEITVDNCGSAVTDTYLQVLSENQTLLYENDTYTGTGACSNTQSAYIKIPVLFPGTYYIVSDGAQNGNITTTIKGTTIGPMGDRMITAIDAGKHEVGFNFTDTKNTASEFTNQFIGKSTNDVFYKFILTQPMNITVSHCGSAVTDTYMSILNTSGTVIYSNDNYTGEGKCTNTGNSVIKVKQMPVGTYYVVSEGNTINGLITTNIEGYSMYGNLNPTKGQPNMVTITPTIEIDSLQKLEMSQQKQNIQYFDYYGYPTVNIQRNFAPLGGDLITLQETDDFFRESSSWLPILKSTSGGQYISPDQIKSDAKTTTLYGNDQRPYSKTIYDGSPLNLIVEQYGVGNDWFTNNRSVKTDRMTNAGLGQTIPAVEVTSYSNGNQIVACEQIILKPGFQFAATTDKSLLIKIDPNICYSDYYEGASPGGVTIAPEQLAVMIYKPTDTGIKNQGKYQTGTLNVTRVTDEDNNISYEFKDKIGRVVLTRQMSGTVQYDTYSIYDDYGNLRYVLPPLASDVLTATNTTWMESTAAIKDYSYIYKYDVYNRCIYKKLPGCEPVYYVYDKADRVIFVQDGEQRAKSTPEWTYTIPDAFGRTVLTGICTNSLTYTADPLKNILVKATYNTLRTNLANSYIISGVTLSTSSILLANFYDSYTFIGITELPNNANTQYNAETGYGAQYTGGYKGQLTGILTAQMNPDGTVNPTYLYSVMYYDNRGRLVQTKSNNQLTGGLEKEYIAYSFTGQPTQKKHIHSVTGKNTQTEVYAYTYDHAGRLLKTTHQLTDGTTVKPQVTLAENSYDELGRLQTNKKNNQANLTTSYTYNVRSWTKSITSPLFNQTLFYNESYGGSAKLYNGNISAISWKHSDETATRGYAFAYDNLSRLTTATYLQNATANNNYKSAYTYDKHGNMTTLQRYGLTAASTYGSIDNLTMSYAGNQLIKAEDAVATISLAESADFKNYSNVATEYTYNKNGALSKDLNKGISAIEYNSLNLPRQMDIKSPVGEGRNKYTYSAGGGKLRVEQKWNPNYSTTPVIGSGITESALTKTETTDYVGNIIYESHSDGTSKTRILVDGGYIENGAYFFYLNDHLGNNRVVTNATGAVTQKNHYYPFGTTFAESTSSDNQPYKYNGKELDKMHGLNLYDYSARYYESAIGRFTTVDPLAESYYSWSPYAYVGNNPIKRIDPTGMDWYEDEDGNVTWLRNETGAEYKDGNGKVWKRVGDTRTVVTADNQAIIFGQKTDKDGNQTLTSTIYRFGEEISDEQNEKNPYFATAAGFMRYSSESENSPIPGSEDFKVWSLAGTVALYGVAVETISLFSKTARGNHRDDGLRDWTDEEIAGALGGLTGQLTKQQKALKQRLTKEQKVRGNRNVQKKGTEKGTGTGRK